MELSNIPKQVCLSFLLTVLFLPNNFGEDCTGSPQHTNPSLVTILDLSQCNIHSLQESNFKLYPNLQTLDLSHNLLEEIDFSVFQFNTLLEHLDISHNKLEMINCSSLQFIKGIKHLSMSYNNFETAYLCPEFSSLTKLDFLGLSSKKIRQDDFANVALHEFKTVFLALNNLEEYDIGSLNLLKTEKFHVKLPSGNDSIVSFDDFTSTTSLQIYSIILFLSDVFTSTTSLEISDFSCDFETCPTEYLSYIARNSKMSTLILNNVIMPWSVMSKLIEAFWKSSVKHLFIYGFTVINNFDYVAIDVSKGSLESLHIENVLLLVFGFNDHPLPIFSEMNVQNLTMTNSELTFFYCPQYPRIFQVLNFANNGITDGIFKQCRTLIDLKHLNLHNNKLEKLLSLSSMTSTMYALQNLDVSFNSLHYDQNGPCEWSDSLVFLNLSKNKLTESVFKCLPNRVEILDLSRNQIKSITKDIKMLTALNEINLSLNQLSNIPDCSHLSRNLRVLNIDNNLIFSPSLKYFEGCRNVKKISALNNNLVCNCEIRAFARSVETFEGEMVGWPLSYTCKFPEELRGTALKNLNLSEVSCNIYLLIGIIVSTVLVVIFLIILTCKLFDVPWYLKMLTRWLRGKYRVRQVNVREIQKNKHFHAFISYSEKDGIWVREVLMANLERDDGSIRLCLHERDFVPGKAIMDNIICCIEKSFKSIFILSMNFLQSEWCNYELHFAQHTSLFGRNSDNLILILLEPIPQYLIPNKCTKLKALMKQRTYMEWPKEKAKQGLFWANLRATIQIELQIQEEIFEEIELEAPN